MKRRHHVEAVMGTAVSIELIGDPDAPLDRLISDLVDWFHHVDQTFSPYRADSPITRIGRGEPIDDLPSATTAEIVEVLQRCHALYGATDGVFDVWNLPSPNGTRFDPCGYVKGWSVQRAAALLEAAGVMRYCINAGGDVLVGGSNPDDEPWQIGIRHPHHADQLAMIVSGFGPMAVATSGTYERGAHIIDPRSGDAVTDIASLTVIGRDLAAVDAYATAAFAMGASGLTWITEQTDCEAVQIGHDLTLEATAGMSHYLAGSSA